MNHFVAPAAPIELANGVDVSRGASRSWDLLERGTVTGACNFVHVKPSTKYRKRFKSVAGG